MINWIRELAGRFPLRTKILAATILVVLLFTGAGVYQVLTSFTQIALDQVGTFGRNLLENTYSAIKYPMSVGDSRTVEEQLKDIKGNMKGVEVFITDFRGDITYASEEDRIHSNMNLYFQDEGTRRALADILKTGMSHEGGVMEIGPQESFLITMKPVLNEKGCHHCHGARQKVLGAMTVKQPVKDVLDMLKSTRNRLLIHGALGVVGIILVLNFVLSRLVTRRIRNLAEKTGLVSAGDVSVEVQDSSRDSIGVLTRNFNRMIKDLRDRIEFANSLKYGISDPFFMVDPQRRITYINSAAAAYLGGGVEEVQNKHCHEVFHSNVCKTACPVQRAMENGEPTVGNRILLKGSDGNEVHIVASAAALKDSTGKILGAFELMRDITREVQAEALLQSAYHKEEGAKRELQERVERLAAVLSKVSEGDLSVRAESSGTGDAMELLVLKTNDTLDRMEELICLTSKAAMTVIKGIHYMTDEYQALAQRTQQQAATMEQISATVEELIANIQQNAGNTQRVDNLSKEAVSVAQGGGDTVGKTAQAMIDMAQASRKIVEMMDLINEITFQTNLLSINAAVEAARAGEQGRGFAVVANEVRNLAKRSSEASKGIQNLVRDIMDRMAASKDWVGELENGFQVITQTIRQASESLTEVSYATQESSQGVHQIGQGIREMSLVIEANAALMDELAEAAEYLSEKAGLLQTMTEKFVVGDRWEVEGEEFEFEKPGHRKKRMKNTTRTGASRAVRSARGGKRSLDEAGDRALDKDLDNGFEEF